MVIKNLEFYCIRKFWMFWNLIVYLWKKFDRRCVKFDYDFKDLFEVIFILIMKLKFFGIINSKR